VKSPIEIPVEDIENLQRNRGEEAVRVAIEAKGGDFLDPPQSIGHRIGMNVQALGGALGASVVVEEAA
jgi:hypothetical protein